MASPAAILDILVKAETAKASAELKVFDKRLQAVDKSAQSSSKSMDKFGRDADRTGRPVDSVSGKLLNLNQAFLAVGNSAKLLRFPAAISAVRPAAQGVSALAAGTTALTGALVPAAGAATGAAAAYGAMGQAAGVIALSGISDLGTAVGGLNEKLDTQADAFKALSPQAQKFAKELDAAKKPIKEIQQSVQGPLFRGLDVALEGIMQFASGPLRKVLTDTSRRMGKLAEQGARLVSREGFGRDFEKIGAGNARVLSRMGKAGLNVANALRHVMVVAQPLVGWMSKAVVTFSEYVLASAKAGRKSGDLARFFEDTKKILSIVVPAVGDFGKALWNILRVGNDLGTDMWQKLADLAEEFRKWTESAKGENALRQWFEDAKKPLWELGRLIRDIGKEFGGLGEGNKGITALLKTLRKDLLPVIGKMFRGTDGFAMVFVDFATESAKALTPFLGPSGPLTALLKGVTGVLRIFNDLIEAVPILGTALVTMAGMRTVQNLLSLFGMGGKGAKGAKPGGIMGGMLGGGGGTKGLSGAMKGLAKMGAQFAGFMAAMGALQDPGSMGGRGRLFNVTAMFGLTGTAAEEQAGKFRDLAKMVKDAGTNFKDLDAVVQQINIAQGMDDITSDMGDKLREMVNDSRRQAERLQNALNANLDLDEIEHGWSRHMRNMAGISQKELDRIGDLLRDKPRKGVEAFSAAMDRMVQSIRQAMKDGEISTRKGNKKIHSILIDQLGAYGISHGGAQKIIQATEQGGMSAQRGGPIDQGRPSGDSVPAMLEKGEYVLNRNAVSAVGKGQLDALNFGAAKRFAVGGMAGLQPGITRLAQWANKRYGLNISTGGGYRPGDSGSYHGIGAAVDLIPPGMTATKGIFGAFKNQLAELFYDPWGGWNDGQMIGPIGDHLDHIHAAILGAGAGAAKGFGAAKIKLPRFKATAEMFTPGAAGLNNSARALEKIMGKRAAASTASAGHGNIGNISGPLQSIARRMVQQRWGAAQWPFFNDLVNRESGWDPTAVNPSSGAAGLAQALPPSKYPPGAWPYTGKSSGVKQLQWMIQYIAGRYGDPAGAISWHNSHNWYQQGGMVGMQAGGESPFAPKGRFGRAHMKMAQIPVLRKKLGKLAGRIGKTDESIGIAQTLAGLSTSPGGSDLSSGEKNQQVGLLERLMGHLVKQKQFASMGLRLSKRFGKPPGFFKDVLTEVQGVTGRGGRIFDTSIALKELQAAPLAGAGGISIDDLLRIREGATLGLFSGLGSGGAAPAPSAAAPSAAPQVNINYANGMEWLRDFVSVQVDGRDRRTNIRSLAGVRR